MGRQTRYKESLMKGCDIAVAPTTRLNAKNAGEARKRGIVCKNIIWKEILAGTSLQVIRQRFAEDIYKLGSVVSPKYVNMYIGEVLKQIKAEYEDTVPVMKERLTATLFAILERCAQDNDKSNAIKAVQEIAKITGAYSQGYTAGQKISISFGFRDEDITVEGEVVEAEEEEDGA